jgi:peptide/nickel transport system permease protein
MLVYLIRRMLLAIPTLFGVTIIVFMLIQLLPGNAVQLMFQEQPGYARSEDELRHILGLDRPVIEQYARWVGNVLKGDPGSSLQTKRPVTHELRSRIPVTIELGGIALIFGLLIAIPIGILSAIKRDSLADYAARGLAISMMSIPSFWLGTLVITLPSIWWHWTPSAVYTKFTEDPVANLSHIFLPALVLAFALSGTTMRLTRTAMLEVLNQDFIRTARAKGLRSRIVITRHALRNAFIPVITFVGLQVTILIGGTVIIESIFTVPGVGRYLIDAINRRDYPVVQGVNLVVAMTVISVNIVIDLFYAMIDPRIRYR